MSEKPNVKWSDIAGLENAKKLAQRGRAPADQVPRDFQGLAQAMEGHPALRGNTN